MRDEKIKITDKSNTYWETDRQTRTKQMMESVEMIWMFWITTTILSADTVENVLLASSFCDHQLLTSIVLTRSKYVYWCIDRRLEEHAEPKKRTFLGGNQTNIHTNTHKHSPARNMIVPQLLSVCLLAFFSHYSLSLSPSVWTTGHNSKPKQ